MKARRTMLGLHWPDLLIIFGILVLIFGASRLPQIGGSIGKTIKEFQKSMREVSPAGDTATPIAPPASDASPQPAEPPRQ
jgi:sec-independent protein translocase protein TatA